MLTVTLPAGASRSLEVSDEAPLSTDRIRAAFALPAGRVLEVSAATSPPAAPAH